MGTIGLDELVPLMKLVFLEGKTVTLEASGRSMMPLLRDGVDKVVLAECKDPRKLKKRDVPLYHRADGKYVLHRIMKVTESGFYMCGDAQWEIEKGIPFENIDALAVGFIKGKKLISTKNLSYRFYSFFWCVSLKLRKFLIKVARRLRRGKNEK